MSKADSSEIKNIQYEYIEELHESIRSMKADLAKFRDFENYSMCGEQWFANRMAHMVDSIILPEKVDDN